MSPNGRRAWRRWAKKRLDIVDGFVSSAWLDVQYWNKWRRHRKSLNPHRTIGLLPPKPFTARSLVGMTMGSRKRIRRSISKLLARMHANLASLGHQHDADRDDSFLRIGERLRPCPGCPECEHGKCWRCDNCGTTKGLCDLTLAEVRCKCGKGCGQWRISFPATTVCNGSGVLPARHQLCLGCSWCGTPPKEDATRFTECDGSGVLPARRP